MVDTASLTFRGVVRYNFDDAARDPAIKTIRLFGRDFECSGALHEYYQPKNGAYEAIRQKLFGEDSD